MSSLSPKKSCLVGKLTKTIDNKKLNKDDKNFVGINGLNWFFPDTTSATIKPRKYLDIIEYKKDILIANNKALKDDKPTPLIIEKKKELELIEHNNTKEDFKWNGIIWNE